jgi:plasmid maintenance system antidote protein VapI
MALKNPPVAQVFPPDHFIREELAARGWTRFELSRRAGKLLKMMSAIASGKTPISPEIAHALGRAFGTSNTFWLNLSTAAGTHDR